MASGLSVPNVKALNPNERQKALVQHNADALGQFIVRGNRCSKCVLVKTFCVCRKLEALSISVSGHSFAVLMNQREQYRSSNTAKVIESVVGGRIFIDGLGDVWERFERLISEYSGRCFVLFPSTDSTEYSEFRSLSHVNEQEDVLVIVVDGTWRQARRLNKKIPSDIPRVKITPTTLSKFLCRRQTQVDRVCTAEALSLLLVDMEQCEASFRLDSGLSVLVEGYNMQCYGSSLRPAHMLKDLPHVLKKGNSLPPRHPDSRIDHSTVSSP
jgi:DTW domain-containing protein YfiP